MFYGMLLDEVLPTNIIEHKYSPSQTRRKQSSAEDMIAIHILRGFLMKMNNGCQQNAM